MDPSDILDAKTMDLSDLLGNGKTYAVPPFQRDYAWSEEEWEDLWFDLESLESGEEPSGHYLGYVVLQTQDSKEFRVIDGQQRLATLSIVVLAVLKHLTELAESGVAPEDNRARLELLRTRFIGHRVASSLMAVSKLRLNRNDDDFYQGTLVQLRKPPPRIRQKPSVRRLQEAFEYFYGKIGEHFAGRLAGEKLANFVELIGDALLFTVVIVHNDLRAYRVFETLNARGVKLSATDLLKNYLFSIIHQQSAIDLQQAERLWREITDQLGEEDFPTFARHLWNATEPVTRKAALFKAIKSRIHTREDAFSFLDRLEATAPVFVALSRPEELLWSPDEREWLRALRVFGITQFFPLALATFEKGIPPADRAKMFRVCAVVSIRYNVISGLNPNAMETAYNRAALDVRSGKIDTARRLYHLLRREGLYVEDRDFQTRFAVKSIRVNNRFKRGIRYILARIEEKLVGTKIDEERKDVTIEHILPENPGSDWDTAFPPDERERYTDRLANYTLLEASLNKKAGQASWTAKQPEYARSGYLQTRELAGYASWTPEALSGRAEHLAKVAAQVWRLDFD